MEHHMKLLCSNEKACDQVLRGENQATKNQPVMRCHQKATDGAVALINHDNASQGLLQLPVEIKDMIYKCVLGGMLLHKASGTGQPRWIICRATKSEEDVQRRFDQAKAPAWCVEDDANRHRECTGYPHYLPGLDMNLLLVCRQVHRQAKHILFSTNTFSFHGCTLQHMPTKPFRPFPSRDHHLAVRSIHLDISFSHVAFVETWKMIIPQIAEVLPNLRNINISLDQGASYISQVPIGTLDLAHDDAAWWEALMQSLLDLAILPLRSATFDINDRNIKHRWSNGRWSIGRLPPVLEAYPMAEELYRWTLAEKQARAKAVKEAILKSSS